MSDPILHDDKVPECLLCPFCGSEPVVYEIPPHEHHIAKLPPHKGSFFIECSCGAGFGDRTFPQVKGLWNRRHASSLKESTDE